MKNIETKSALGLFAGVIGYITGRLTELIIILLFLIIMDFVLGIIAGMKHDGFDKNKTIWGAVKKICYGFLILLGFLIDYVILYFTEQVGYQLPVQGAFGIAVTLYLIGGEGFSCGQNLILIGVKVPNFIEKAFGLLRDASGNLVKVIELDKESEAE